jgi:nicotinamidase-related amidase
MTGMATNFCCLCTTIDAFNRDYHVLFVEDLNCTFDGIDGTPAEVMHRVTVETIKQGYAVEVLNSEALMKRLAQEAPVLV